MRLLRRIAQRERMLGPDPYEPPHNPYDYDPHIGGGYPGDRAPPPDLTDLAQMIGLGPMEGDTEVTHQTLNHPWGKVVRLQGNGASITLVQTEAAPRPFPWAIQARYSLDGKTYQPTVPASWGGDLLFKFTKSFDVKTGPAIETFDLIAGEQLPICALISRKLTVTARTVGESLPDLWVAFVVCPTTQIDCAESSGVPQEAGFADATSTRSGAVAATTYTLPANAKRAYLVVSNESAVDLFVKLGAGVVTTPGSESATIRIPANTAGGYEVLNYRGVVTYKFAADDGSGYALVTEGIAA